MDNSERSTVKKFARSLEIDPELIPPSLCWPEAAAVVRDTNAVVVKTQAQIADLQGLVAKLVELQQVRAREFDVEEGVLIARRGCILEPKED